MFNKYLLKLKYVLKLFNERDRHWGRKKKLKRPYSLHPWTMYKVELYSQPRIGSPILYTGKLKIKN
jgi:hypothetical protein